MFTKLRNKFLILNMSITSMVMITAFAVIYFITYSNIHSEIQNKLKARSETQIRTAGINLLDDMEKGVSIVRRFSLEDLLSFNVEVDPNGRILKIYSFIDMPEEVYYKAVAAAWSSKRNNSTITLEGKQWQYLITQMGRRVILKNGQQYSLMDNKYQITFLDITESNRTLFELLITLLFVGLIMLFVIFIISLYFANRSIKPIAETWEKQKQFIADASHELKTPLSIINANYDALLANQEETIKSQLKWLDYIKIGTDRMTKLINDLLSLAKIEDVNFEMQKMPFNISNAVHDVLSSMEAVAIEKGIQLSHSIEADIIVKSDLEKVKQVITILFDNAIKYSNENGQIDISLIKSKRQVIYSIKNSGKGIAKQDLPKVFDRFYRADPSRTHENGGYGLGLSIAKTIIDGLGGEIHVASVENEYTTFSFTLGL
ncbi:sensor histidine kinase [Geosporobacter ferrireducens]|uniref:histidine kinase n=1 Tax=Geosporobacter ferrireducens TaxID=1424294 RepID=A0A1D8GM54_9FIRM|nr:HAMP domain-containing sensor histidine kinase [Geosporobacter ferrireducens]AOT71993.1 two-component sensor histidine kinase [Geosporobacter ferrireducens]